MSGRQRAKTMALTVGDSEGVEQGEVVRLDIGARARVAACANAPGHSSPMGANCSAGGPLPHFPSNRVTTSKYTLLNFVPKFLFEAYHHASNLYFTFDLIIQLIPGVTPIPPVTTALPLLFVLGVSAAREAVEDYARHEADEETNGTVVEVLRGGEFKPVPQAQLVVGDVVKVHNEQEFPADLILLASSNPAGICYDMTANLDGETNLKLHRVPVCTRDRAREPRGAWDLSATFKFELPNARIHNFNGSVMIDHVVHSLDTQHLMLRGAQLRNTDWIVGVVAYAGEDTKLSRNQQQPPSRMSVMEKRLNMYVIYMFILQFVSICSMATLSVVWEADNVPAAWYLYDREFDSLVVLWLRNYGTWFILLALYIPISLFVTLEVARFIQALFMRWDRLDPPELTKSLPWGNGADASKSWFVRLMTHVGGIKPRTSSLNEDLGCIEYVFSDKTGTLTVNKMRFANAYVRGGLRFNEAENPGSIAAALGATDDATLAENMEHFLQVLSLYNTESTDELALVTAASNNGWQLLERSMQDMVISVSSRPGQVSNAQDNSSPSRNDSATEAGGAGSGAGAGVGVGAGTGAGAGGGGAPGDEAGKRTPFELLATLEFTSARRRMSVVVRQPDGRIFLLSKGADLVMFERMASGQNAVHERFEKYADWKVHYDAASSSINNRAQRVAEAAQELERDLVLIGATAIEDQLQDEVPSTIAYLRQAGIKVWVLTGDKRSTAISVAFSARLVTPKTTLLKVQVRSVQEAAEQMTAAMRRIQSTSFRISPATPSPSHIGGPPPHTHLAESSAGYTVGATRAGDEDADADEGDENGLGFCLVLDGRSLRFLLSRQGGNRAAFFDLIDNCESVIVCRATPLQKADVVSAVQNELGRITLSIGDGANDVSMIQKAHVGVGVLGREGTQAARSADYAISQFRHLKRLMAVHGRYSYIRLALVIKYSFYKNLTFTILPVWSGLQSGFTGQTLHDAVVLMGYNMVFTMLPPFIHGLFEKDISEELIEAHPKTYRYTQSRAPFRLSVYLLWLLNALWHSVAIYYGCEFAFAGEILGDSVEGREASFWGFSLLCSTVTVFVVLLKAALITKHWVIFDHIVIWGSMAVYLFIIWLYTLMDISPYIKGVLADEVFSPLGMLTIVGVTVGALLPDFALAAYTRWYKPHDWEVLREQERKGSRPLMPTG